MLEIITEQNSSQMEPMPFFLRTISRGFITPDSPKLPSARVLRQRSFKENEIYKIEKYDLTSIPQRNCANCNMSFATLNSLSFMTRGSNSNIYKARLRGYNRKVVVKVLMEDPPDLYLAHQDFVLEQLTLCRLNHENIVECMGYGLYEIHKRSLPFIVLQRLKGGTLKSLLSRCTVSGTQRPSLPLSMVVYIALSLASALNYLHNDFHPLSKCIHRDLKPDNIGFTEDGVLKLMDFGLCACVEKGKTVDDRYTMTGYTGSLRYMAPEVIQYQPYNEKVDIYSYGIILWQVATSITPYKDIESYNFEAKVVGERYRPPVDTLPIDLAKVISDCWHPNSKCRISTIDLFQSIQNLSNTSPIKTEVLETYFRGRKPTMKDYIVYPFKHVKRITRRASCTISKDQLDTPAASSSFTNTTYESSKTSVTRDSYDIDCISNY